MVRLSRSPSDRHLRHDHLNGCPLLLGLLQGLLPILAGPPALRDRMRVPLFTLYGGRRALVPQTQSYGGGDHPLRIRSGRGHLPHRPLQPVSPTRVQEDRTRPSRHGGVPVLAVLVHREGETAAEAEHPVVPCGETVEGDQVFGVCRWGRVDLAQVSAVRASP